MSGGVDSSVAAYLLQKEGYELSGLTMCLGVQTGDDEKARCCGPDAVADAKKVCNKLDIPHFVLDFSRDLEEKVIQNFVSEYVEGRTPNPCVECNRYLKFGLLLQKARAMGFSYLATGHYARIEHVNNHYLLKKAADSKKDQTYFLNGIKRESLPFLLFPLSDYTKDEVRAIAKKAGLPVHNKPQSQDICFITDPDYHAFLKERVSSVQPGDIINNEGVVLGEHRGVCFYTIGQREGLGISHKKPLYVVKLDAEKNEIIVGEREDLTARGLIASDCNMLVDELPEKCTAKIRYGHNQVACTVKSNDNELIVMFDEAQQAVTPGQSVVFLNDDIILGGAKIKQVIS